MSIKSRIQKLEASSSPKEIRIVLGKMIDGVFHPMESDPYPDQGCYSIIKVATHMPAPDPLPPDYETNDESQEP